MSKKIDFDKPLSVEDRRYVIERGWLDRLAENEGKFGAAEDKGKTLQQVREELVEARQAVMDLEMLENRLMNPNVAHPAPSPSAFPPVGGTAVVGPTDNTPVNGEGPEGAEEAVEDEYNSWTKADLQDEIEERNRKDDSGLSATGTKAELVERLRADDRKYRRA